MPQAAFDGRVRVRPKTIHTPMIAHFATRLAVSRVNTADTRGCRWTGIVRNESDRTECSRAGAGGSGCALLTAAAPTGKGIARDREAALEPAGAGIVRTPRARVSWACHLGASCPVADAGRRSRRGGRQCAIHRESLSPT